jgi:hypothetical protein
MHAVRQREKRIHDLDAAVSLTVAQVLRDPESATGWTVEIGPFPGWETVPTW